MVTGDVPLTSFEIATWYEQEKLEGAAMLVEHWGIEGPLDERQGEDGEPKGEGMGWTLLGEEGKRIIVSNFCCLGFEVVRIHFWKETEFH